MQDIDNGTEVPIGKKRHDLLLDALQPPLRIGDRIDIVLKDDLLGGMIEGQC